MERQGNSPADDIPLTLIVEGTHGPVIHATNRTARTMGVQIGARVVDMRAICPELQTEYADREGDKAAQNGLYSGRGVGVRGPRAMAQMG